MKFIPLFIAIFLITVYGAEKKSICIVTNEPEYQTEQTLQKFAEQMLNEKFKIHYVTGVKDDRNKLTDLDSLAKADLLVLSVRRLALPKEQLELIKTYLKSGKPLLAIRTSTHAFVLNEELKAPEGSEQWESFDQEILGCKYNKHYDADYLTSVSIENKKHPALQSVKSFTSRAWLYKVAPLGKNTSVLLNGKLSTNATEPVAWINKNNFGGQVIATTLGHQEDFLEKQFINFLYNSVYYLTAEKTPKTPPSFSLHNNFVEKNFPFITTVLDCSKLPAEFPKDNISSRGIILKMENNSYACFDPDLLKYTAFWQGDFINLNTMAPGSYNTSTSRSKTPQGENNLPTIKGTPLIALGNFPGIEKGQSTWNDPRDKNLNLLCKGPIPEKSGRWQGLHLTSTGSVISYTLGETKVFESVNSRQFDGEFFPIERQIKTTNFNEKLIFHIGQFGDRKITVSKNETIIKIDEKNSIVLKVSADSPVAFNSHPNGLDLIAEPAAALHLSLFICQLPNDKIKKFLDGNFKVSLFPDLNKKLPTLWQQKEFTSVKPEKNLLEDELILTDIAIPVVNSFGRNVRISGIDFFRDGRAAVCTFDGDVWIIENIQDKEHISWKRFASGLYEPLSLKIYNDKIYLFDRLGILCLHDQDGNGEADFYENFCNIPIQTPESREFPLDMVIANDGSFLISKGGTREKTINPHAGSILKIAPDGLSMQILATGLREPFMGIDFKTNDVFASDQQGNFVPTTPFHFIQQGSYYGFKEKFSPSNNLKISEPATWIPHRINQSGAGIIKLYSDNMKQLNNSLLYLDYYGASLGKVYFDRQRPLEAVYLRLKQNFSFPLLKGAVNPKDGLLYVCGFQIWGTQTTRTCGLARLAPAKKSLIPSDIRYFKEGILLRFNEKINKNSINPSLFKMERWNYLRSEKYGSAHYKLNGETGQENVLPSTATLSNDGKSVFIAVPDMKLCMQMSLSWKLLLENNSNLDDVAYFSVNTLNQFSPEKENFPEIDFSAPAIAQVQSETLPPSIELGEKTVIKYGCIGCHSTSSEKEEKVGPAWGKIFNSKRELTDNSSVVADENYLKESILEPSAKTSKGYTPAMPSYKGILQENELEAVILYLKSLK